MISDKDAESTKAMRDLKDRILQRIRAKDAVGEVYTNKDFLDLGRRAAVDQALSRLVKEKALRRLGRGLFDLPRVNPTLGLEISPDPDRVAAAITRKRGGRVRPSGAFAANALGLTTQVPGRRVYLTDTDSHRMQVGNQSFTFKRVAPKSFGADDGPTSSVLQALQFLGKDGVTDEVIDRIRSLLSAKDKKKLLRDSRYVMGWIAEAARRAASD